MCFFFTSMQKINEIKISTKHTHSQRQKRKKRTEIKRTRKIIILFKKKRRRKMAKNYSIDKITLCTGTPLLSLSLLSSSSSLPPFDRFMGTFEDFLLLFTSCIIPVCILKAIQMYTQIVSPVSQPATMWNVCQSNVLFILCAFRCILVCVCGTNFMPLIKILQAPQTHTHTIFLPIHEQMSVYPLAVK